MMTQEEAIEYYKKPFIEKMSIGFQKIEDYRLVVKYILVHPKDYDNLIKNFEYTNLDGKFITGEELLVWGAKIVKTDVQQEGIILACSQLFEPEPPLNTHQITSLIDISHGIE